MKRWNRPAALFAAVLMAMTLTLPACADDVPYYQYIEGGRAIFEGPSYNYDYVDVVEETGVYTIVEEVRDGSGCLWGRLKSGRGWVLLEEAPSIGGGMDLLITASINMQPSGAHYRYVQEASEYTAWLNIGAQAAIRNVQLVSFEVAEAGMKVDQVLYTVPEMQPAVTLEAGVVFYGDMTSYGVICTDQEGSLHCFIFSISGYDGSLVVEECDLIAMPAVILG